MLSTLHLYRKLKQKYLMKKEMVFLILLVIVVITSCTIIPGSDQWKIRLAATNYVESKLSQGETMEWGYIERKLSRYVDGRECKYAEVKYKIKSNNNESDYKTLYLIMSEHCDSVYNISENIIY